MNKFKNLTEDIIHRMYVDEALCKDYLAYVRWGAKPYCPRCGYKEIGRIESRDVYKCRYCDYQFSEIVGTIFENSPLSLCLWFKYLYLLIDNKHGFSARQFAMKNGVHYGTALRMHHKIMEVFYPDFENIKKKTGVFECDDLNFGPVLKWLTRRNRKKHSNKAGHTHQRPVAAIYKRDGALYLKAMPLNTKKEQEQEVIKKLITKKSTVYTDKSTLYQGMEDHFDVFKCFNHSIGQYGDGADGHTNGVNNAARMVKAALSDYVAFSSKYTQRYLNEAATKVNCALNQIDSPKIFALLMKNINRTVTVADIRARAHADEEYINQNIKAS